MPAKNSIQIKIAFEKTLLCAALACGVKLKKCKFVSKTHVAYTIQTTHFQKLFELGYQFNKIHSITLYGK